MVENLPGRPEVHLTAIATAVPELAEWATARLDGSTHGHRIPVDLAAALLESVDSLSIIGVELVAPERLVRKSPSTRAIVTPLPSGGQGVTGRLAAGALVAWQPTIDNTPITEEQLAKAALQGATLIQVGGRWVQVDRAEAKRALANLHTQRQREVVSPLELLKLAAELEAELAAQQARSGIAGIDDIPAPTDSDAFGQLIQGEGWAADLLAGLPDSNLHEGVEPEGFRATLRPYQRRGLGWLQFLRTLGLGGCLADDMGLGKTVQAIAVMLDWRRQEGRRGALLIVCPVSVLGNWRRVLARFAPSLRVTLHHGKGRAETPAEFDKLLADNDIVLTSYNLLQRDEEIMTGVTFEGVLLDEAQNIKNPTTKQSRVARKLRGNFRLALTGTPLENRPLDLWSIMDFLNEGLLGSRTQFLQTLEHAIVKQRRQSSMSALAAKWAV